MLTKPFLCLPFIYIEIRICCILALFFHKLSELSADNVNAAHLPQKVSISGLGLFFLTDLDDRKCSSLVLLWGPFVFVLLCMTMRVTTSAK